KIKRNNSGVVADIQGKFTLQVASDDVLVITAAGYENTEVPVGTGPELSITMQLRSTLNEVVVTALGIRRQKNELPYAAQQVQGDEIVKTRGSNFVNSLSGKVAGLQIKNNNNLGGSTNVILRGYKSITGDNQALIVVDGVPVNNSNVNTSTQQNGFGGFDY